MKRFFRPIPEISHTQLILRCVWISIQLILAYWFSNQVSPFFYQRF